MNAAPLWPRDEADSIRRALMVEGGHLFVHASGYTLGYDGGSLCGHIIEPVRTACVAAGLPVIDTRMLPFDETIRLAIDTPIIAIGVSPNPEPWRSLSYAPLHHVAALYHAAGAEVVNMPEVTAACREATA